MRNLISAVCLGLVALALPFTAASQTAARPAATVPVRTTEGPDPVPEATLTQFDAAAVRRGQTYLASSCGFCHGATARGGSSGPDLTRSELVQNDVKGKDLGAFLKVGRPEKAMPAFQISAKDLDDLQTYLHAAIFLNANRKYYTLPNIVVGDAAAGKTYFASHCTTCHAESGDMKGIGAKYEPADIQSKIVMPRPSAGPGAPAIVNPWKQKNAVRATVQARGAAPVSGALVRLSDFDVVLYDSQTDRTHSWTRNDGEPRVTVTDPLQAHIDHRRVLKDSDMHNLTAYLTSLK